MGREGMKAVGGRFLFLPPYRPDLNPIEMALDKIKYLSCKAAERTVRRLWSTKARNLESVLVRKCRNPFAAAGLVLDKYDCLQANLCRRSDPGFRPGGGSGTRV